MRKLMFICILFLMSASRAIVPVISVMPSDIYKNVCYGCEFQGSFTVSASQGDEQVEVLLTKEKEIANILDFLDYSFTIGPNETREIEYTLRPQHIGEYSGRITLEVKGVQVNWVNFSAGVSREYGRFLIEAYEGDDIVEDFDARVYHQGTLVFEKKGARGYCLSDYLDFGDYSIIISGSGYISSNKLIPLYENQKRIIFELEPEASRHLQIYPKNVFVHTCESEETTLITLENVGEIPLNVSLSVPPYLLSVGEKDVAILPGTSRTIPVTVKSLPRGNYSTALNISFLDRTEEVKFNMVVYPKEDCVGREIVSQANYSSAVHMDSTHVRHVPIYLKFGDYSGRVSVDVSSGTSTEIFPKVYKSISPGDEVVFMLKLSNPVSDFVSIEIRTGSGASFYPIRIYASELISQEIVMEEIGELYSFFGRMRERVLNLTEAGYDTGNSLYLINKATMSLDLAEDLAETDPVQAKNLANTATNDISTIIEQVYRSNISGRFPYYLLLIPILIVPSAAIIIARKRESESEIRKKQKQSI